MCLSEAIRLRILELCTTNNINVNKLAISSGINPSTVRSILKSRCKAPNSQTLYYLCIGFNISLLEFFNSPLFSNLDDD